jgi:hypothetical protein
LERSASRGSLGFLLARLAAAAWGALIVGGLVVGAVGPESWRHAITHDGPGCPFRAMTGVDCPFCGMTRATVAMGGGDFGSAFGFHPFAPFLLVAVLAILAIVILGKTELLMRGRRPLILLSTVLVMWALRLVI